MILSLFCILLLVLMPSLVLLGKWVDHRTAKQNPEWKFGQHHEGTP